MVPTRMFMLAMLLTCLPLWVNSSAVAGDAAAPKYTPQTYVEVLTGELGRFKTRLERDKADATIKTAIDAAVAEGEKLLGIVNDLIKTKHNFDTAEFKTSADMYLQLKRRIPYSVADEIAHLQTWIDAHKSDAKLANVVAYYDGVMTLLKRALDNQEKNNKMAAQNSMAQFTQREATADAYHASGQYPGLGPDTARGDYILARLARDPNVTIVTVEQPKLDFNDPAVRRKYLNK